MWNGGYVERRGSARARSPTFVITASGTARLKALLAQPVQQVPPRNGLLLRLFFGRQLGPDVAEHWCSRPGPRPSAAWPSTRDSPGAVEEEEHTDDRPYGS
jgi:hypothetical protein